MKERAIVIIDEFLINRIEHDGYLDNILSKPMRIDVSNWPIIDYSKYDEYYGSGSFIKAICDETGMDVKKI